MNMVCYPHDAAFGLRPRDPNGSWTSGVSMFHAVPAGTGLPGVRSRFESIALRTNKMPSEAGDLPGILLASTFSTHGRGCRVLRPLWAEEAVHRAYSFVRLVDNRVRCGHSTRENPMVAEAEDAIACDLAVCLGDLTVGSERNVLPCSDALRKVTTSLGALFGGPANIALEGKIEDLWLPAYKRRALVLTASELVSNALLHAFRGCASGRIEVSLAAVGATSACLQVADNGDGFGNSAPNLDCGVASGLAGLLEADLTYDRRAGRTIAEIEFPVAGSWPGIDWDADRANSKDARCLITE